MRRLCCVVLLAGVACSPSTSTVSVAFPPNTGSALSAIVIVAEGATLDARALNVTATTAIEFPGLSSGAKISLMLFGAALSNLGVAEGPLSPLPDGRTLSEITDAQIFVASLSGGLLSEWTSVTTLAPGPANAMLLPPVGCPTAATASIGKALTKTSTNIRFVIPFGPNQALLGLAEGAYSISASGISKQTFGSTIALTAAYQAADGSQWFGREDGSILRVGQGSGVVNQVAHYPRLPGMVSSIATSSSGLAFAIVGTSRLPGALYASTGGPWTLVQMVKEFKLPGARIFMLPGGTDALVIDYLQVWRANRTSAEPTLDPITQVNVTPVSLLKTEGRGILLVGEVKSLGTHWYSFNLASNQWTQADPTLGGSATMATPFRNGFAVQSVVDTWYVDDDASIATGNGGICPTPLFARASIGTEWGIVAFGAHSLVLLGRGSDIYPAPVLPVWITVP
jgi:hypothetical protein